jgi:transcriptional regulator with XRE-family HTH domain
MKYIKQIIKNNIVNNINLLLIERNNSIKQLSKDTNISYNTIINYLNHKTLPQIKNLILIADYFKCSLDFLLKNKVNK